MFNALRQLGTVHYTCTSLLIQFQDHYLSLCLSSLPKCHYSSRLCCFFFLALCSDVKFATTPDLNLLYTSDNLFMQIVEPEEISYVYKVRPAKNFGGEFVSERILQVIFFFKNAIRNEWNSLAILLVCICLNHPQKMFKYEHPHLHSRDWEL